MMNLPTKQNSFSPGNQAVYLSDISIDPLLMEAYY